MDDYQGPFLYSERHERFYLNKKLPGKYSGPIDLVDTSSSGFPQMSLYQGSLIDPSSHSPRWKTPESRLQQLEPWDTSTLEQHIVESPSGDIFVVHWFAENLSLVMDELDAAMDKEDPYQSSIRIKPRGFLVFRQDPEQKTSSYIDDMGDLCIFLGVNEPFCVSTAEYPGLKPNSIYFANTVMGFGIYDISSNTVQEIFYPHSLSCCSNWLAPLQ